MSSISQPQQVAHHHRAVVLRTELAEDRVGLPMWPSSSSSSLFARAHGPVQVEQIVITSVQAERLGLRIGCAPSEPVAMSRFVSLSTRRRRSTTPAGNSTSSMPSLSARSIVELKQLLARLFGDAAREEPYLRICADFDCP